MRQRKLGSHTPPCQRRMVITTLFSVMLAALQRRPVLYHTGWLLTVHWLKTRGGGGGSHTRTRPGCPPPPVDQYKVQRCASGPYRTYFKTEKLLRCSRRTTLIPNHNIHGGSQHNVTYPYYIPKIVHSHGYVINMACILGIEKDIRQISTNEINKRSRSIYVDRVWGQVLRKYLQGTQGHPELCTRAGGPPPRPHP